MYILALDPGGTTGWKAFNHEDTTMHGGFLGPLPHHVELWGFLDSTAPSVVICESFQHSEKTGLKLISAEYIGIVKLWCKLNDIPYVPQTSSEGKGFWTDDKLRRVGLYVVNKHIRDATRHLLHYLSFDMHNNTWVEMLRR